MLPETENEPTPVMTKQQRDALAERIDAVLRERKKIGDDRRRRQDAYQRQNGERALARHYKLRGVFRQRSDRRVEEIDRVYDTMMSSNAAL
jgi:hypothetical protein